MGEHPAIPRTRDMVANLVIRGKKPEKGERERSRCGPAHGPIESHCRLSAIKGAQLGPERGKVV